jgi:hypothetical protein
MAIWRPCGKQAGSFAVTAACAAGYLAAITLLLQCAGKYVQLSHLLAACCLDSLWLTCPIAQVHLCGSFTRWVETIPMAPVDGTPGVFAVVVHLPPG